MVPVKPEGQEQTNPSAMGEQVPPLLHGSDEQASAIKILIHYFVLSSILCSFSWFPLALCNLAIPTLAMLDICTNVDC